ncbi:MAG: type II toxin-antitoxin system Phd/YefM family antitoxin [Egibacteraceae bacterium]
MATIGVRDLRQNLSVYLRRVRAGETLGVTERGELVALLTPLPGHEDPLGRLEAQGRLRPAVEDLSDLPPPLEPEPGERPLSELVSQMREDQR